MAEAAHTLHVDVVSAEEQIYSGEAEFVAALVEGANLGEAAERALGAEASFDLSTAFARLLALEAFAALR